MFCKIMPCVRGINSLRQFCRVLGLNQISPFLCVWQALRTALLPHACPTPHISHLISQDGPQDAGQSHRVLLPTACCPQASSSRLCVACVQAPSTAAASRAAPRRAVVCAAARTSQVDVSKAVAAAALAAVIGFGQVDAAKADISGLTPCSESKAYQKRLKNELKALNKRLRNVRGATHAPGQAVEITAQFGYSCGGAGSLVGAQQT